MLASKFLDASIKSPCHKAQCEKDLMPASRNFHERVKILSQRHQCENLKCRVLQRQPGTDRWLHSWAHLLNATAAFNRRKRTDRQEVKETDHSPVDPPSLGFPHICESADFAWSHHPTDVTHLRYVWFLSIAGDHMAGTLGLTSFRPLPVQ